MPGPNINDHVKVLLETEEAPFSVHGYYKGENDDYVYVVGTVGDHIGKRFAIPKTRLKYMEWSTNREDNE